MPRSASDGTPRASRLEIAGAWLRIWTPPRDVEIPPPPRRALVFAAVVVLATVAAILTWAAPAIQRDRDRAAANDERALAAQRQARRARLAVQQRARHAAAPAAARLYADERWNASRAALLEAARASVDRDVRARVAAAELRGPIRSVRCAYRRREQGPRVHLDCLAITAAFTHKGVHRVRIGHPFLVGASLRDGRYAWCKTNAVPGEGSTGRTVSVPLPLACRG